MIAKNVPGVMGVAGIHLSHSQKAELGYWISVPYWGKGYTTEAVKRLIQFGFEEMELNRIFASYFSNNPASGRVMEKAGLRSSDIDWTDTARTESDAALAVLEDKADTALGLGAIAEQLRLGFVPLVRERFDILVDRAAWFDPPLQRLFAFFRSSAFLAKAKELAGYDLSGLGRVHFNGG